VDSPLKTILATIAIAAICAVLLVGIRGVVIASINRNLSIDEQRAILDALDIPGEQGGKAAFAPAVDVEGYYHDYVQKVNGEEGVEQEFDVYRYVVNGVDRGTAVRVFGKGLWGEMRGFLAVDPRKAGATKWTVRGLVFYRDEETPGLGKRIRDDDFKSRFRSAMGKLVPGLKVMKAEGMAVGPQEVDGMTSATITGQGVEEMIDKAIEWYARSKFVLQPSPGGSTG
jgi:Na+-transporting NADH:ubiquinone oxidoreductase subunit NqrC